MFAVKDETHPPTSTIAFRPEWVPLAGHHLWRCGVHFDAVRAQGVRGEEFALQLIERAAPDPGPVVCEAKGFRWTYFLLPPGTAKNYPWPMGVQWFSGTRTIAYIGVPALTGNTWPLLWYSRPTRAAPFVDPKTLHNVMDPAGPIPRL
ncbi:hypothetical protein [Streptomyces abikoensis]|uniref:hypothetical protein n=1 Tax=Streptomyces abikoensis TaxID=97398 RepID=UPI0019C071CD|nr:hypothetical protein [Streptomyces abikoensis]GGP72572.1 hypothetical protein GCM10010214_54520 [Streptomyces abikoensis]